MEGRSEPAETNAPIASVGGNIATDTNDAGVNIDTLPETEKQINQTPGFESIASAATENVAFTLGQFELTYPYLVAFFEPNHWWHLCPPVTQCCGRLASQASASSSVSMVLRSRVKPDLTVAMNFLPWA